jgi:nicotinic acid phosphoribosyltransferase
LCWTSRQHGGAKAIMLFGDRVDKSILAPQDISKALIHEGFVVDSVIALADRLGVTIVS